MLKGQVSDLQERVQLQSGADEHIMTLVNSKASQWQVREVDFGKQHLMCSREFCTERVGRR